MDIIYYILALVINKITIATDTPPLCGCQVMRPCYEKMLKALIYGDEAACVENASIGSSTVDVFLTALSKYCGDFVELSTSDSWTYNMRKMYEVQLSNKATKRSSPFTPVFMLDAGQLGDTESVEFALYLIEQLVACMEHEEFIKNVTWVILPSTNPDGMEYRRYHQSSWTKNMRTDASCFGVDISRNFDSNWGKCDQDETGAFSPNFHGPMANSEKETMHIVDAFNKYKDKISGYVSLRNQGHSILTPYAYPNDGCTLPNNVLLLANNVTKKVNIKAGSVQMFVNETILECNGKPYCGSSVDYAFANSIPLAFEMRMFLGEDHKILNKFQSMPTGFEASLRSGYLAGMHEFATFLMKEQSNQVLDTRRNFDDLLSY